jgi:hypothetical protein
MRQTGVFAQVWRERHRMPRRERPFQPELDLGD